MTTRKRAATITPDKASAVERDIIAAEKVCSEKQPEVETYQKGWFCAAICADGSLFTDEADSPAGVLDILSNAILAWVDFRTNDYEKESCVGGTLWDLATSLFRHCAESLGSYMRTWIPKWASSYLRFRFECMSIRTYSRTPRCCFCEKTSF